MKLGIFLVCTSAYLLPASALATITFDGSPGTNAPPTTLGGYTMTSFGDDTRSIPGSVSDAPGPDGDVEFSPNLTHVEVGSGWLTWSHGYTGDVYYTTGTTIEMTMPENTLAFYFYAEPNVFASYTIEAVADDGTSSGAISVQGHGGATYFGFYATNGDRISTITVTVPSAALGIGIGDLGIYQCDAPTISVSLTPSLLWPPNHQNADIAATVTTSGECGPLTVQLRQITSNEPDNGDDDGNTINDINGADIGAEDYAFQLRKERASSGTGRVYTVTYKVTDANGTEAFGSATVTVPLNGSGSPKPVLGLNEWDGTVLGQNTPNPVQTLTEIPFRISSAGSVQIAVYDVSGNLVRAIGLGDLAAGDHVANWDGNDNAGHRVSAGQYVYRLIGVDGSFSPARTMTVVR